MFSPVEIKVRVILIYFTLSLLRRIIFVSRQSFPSSLFMTGRFCCRYCYVQVIVFSIIYEKFFCYVIVFV